MSTIPSSRHTSELGANSVHRWKAIHHLTSPESSERQELVRQGCRHVCYHRASPKSKVREGLGRSLHHREDPYGFRRWGSKYWPKRSRDILDDMLVPWVHRHFGDSNGHFDNIPLQPTERKQHRSGAQPIFPDFITSAEWPPYSPGLNQRQCGEHSRHIYSVIYVI